MLYTTIAHVDEADVPRLRKWLSALAERREELRESYRTQGTRHEQFFLVRTRHGRILILISELDDVEAGIRTFLTSELPIDLEFKSLYQQISPAEADVELLYDSTKYIDTSDD